MSGDGPPAGAELEQLRRTLFVLWGFPEITETFIHREMMCLEGWGVPVHVLAGVPVRRADELDPRLAAIVARTPVPGH